MFSKKQKNQKLLTNHYSLLTSAGFSLIELLISMAIFVLIIGGVVLFSVRSIQAHTKSQAMQGAIDNARFAVEALNKKIRTSNNINGGADGTANNYTPSTDQIFVIDNVDGTKYCYKFVGAPNNKLQIAKIGTTDGGYLAALDCSSGSFVFSDLVGMGTGPVEVTGRFYLKNSDEINDQRGFVTTVIEISYNDGGLPAERDSFNIQSSVSVRDY